MKTAASAATLVLVIAGIAAARVPNRTHSETKTNARDDPYVQIASITVEPTSIHISDDAEATITVLMIVRGNPPSGAITRVDVGDYSSQPPGERLQYAPAQTQTVQLQRSNSLVVIRFKARPERGTRAGKVRIAATVYGLATKGVSIREPVCPQAWIGELILLP